jgi:DNA helicase-2/ATP-dependent DNA helicase PcrA
MATGHYESYETAAMTVRDRTRHAGRSAEKRSSSRILLIKGLEYDSAVVVRADELTAKELYVAITRGSRNLAIAYFAEDEHLFRSKMNTDFGSR